MSAEMQILIDNYWNWLKDSTTLKDVDGWTEITTPYLDRHNDYVQIYAMKEENGRYILTDDSWTIHDLENSGCNLNTPKRQELLTITLHSLGVEKNGDELLVRADRRNFNQKKHSLLQAIIAVNDLFYLARPMVASFFLEDVLAWLDTREISYIPRVKFTGKSGYDHYFDFAIPPSKENPERIAKAINAPNKSNAEALIFSWIDTRETRPENSKALAILNDEDRGAMTEVEEAFLSYDVLPILWSSRDESIEKFR